MNFLKKIFTRLNVTIILLAVQIIVFAMLMNRIVNFLPYVMALNYFLGIIIVLWLVKKDDSAAYKIIWIIAVITLPISGVILYLLFGNTHPIRRIRNRIKENSLSALLHKNHHQVEDARVASFLTYVQQTSAYPAYANTETKYYPFGELMFEDMLAELAKAKKFIFLQYFIISKGKMWSKILGILLQKAEEGVEVRVMFDDLVSQRLFTRRYEKHLRAKKIKTVRFNPLQSLFSPFMNHRDHRKILVIDGNVGFTGSVNITDVSINLEGSYMAMWKDTGVKLKGEAVWSFTIMFAEIWNSFCKTEDLILNFSSYKCTDNFASKGLVVPYGDSPLSEERLGENVYIEILNQAKEYVYITTPFLIISEKMIYALQMAAKRGVDVRIITPGLMDWTRAIVQRVTRSYYKNLLKAGVKIYEYSPGFLHAKNFVSDDKIAVIGTINLDYRSLYLHFECAALLYQTSSINSVKEDFIDTMEQGREILIDDKRHIFSRFLDAVLHLFAPLM